MAGFRSWWPALSLARQFTLASSALVLAGLGVLGFWVAQKIESGVKAHTAARTALYMESVVAPYLQELGSRPDLSAENKAALDTVIGKDAARLRVVAAKVWTRTGVILYATDKALIGQKFPLTPLLTRAWEGYVEAQFDARHYGDDHGTSMVGKEPLFEIYVPIRHSVTNEIVAVAEFYELTSELNRELIASQINSWLVTAIVSFTIIAGLYTIVANGSKTIETQRTALANRISELSGLLQQNEELRRRVQGASRRAAEATELQLRRLGADLHDGPAQLLALALLKFPSAVEGGTQASERQILRGVLEDAMAEIRNISSGLALPEIEKLSLTQALMVVASEHERRTSTTVACEFASRPIELSHPTKLCLCRFVQEGLSNAYRHAGGQGQAVTLTWSDSFIVVEVADRGPGIEKGASERKRPALGLIGLRNRLESFGGHLTVISAPGAGTRLTAYLPIGA